MNGLQIFAFVVLPAAVAAVGWIVAFIVAPIGWSSKADEQSLSGPPRYRA